jgi:hypothetical protein
MGRTFVGQRKVVPGEPPSTPDENSQSDPEQTDDSAEASGADDTPDDVETCPNCDCQFTDSDDGEDPEIIKPGKKVEGDTSGYKNQGEDLDTSGSEQPVPGKMGTAHDAALGDAVMAQLLGGAHSGMGRVR